MTTSFFGDMLQSIAERGRALIDRTRDRREVAEQRSANLVQLCEELLSGRGEASGVALAREILSALRRADHRPADRLLRGAGEPVRRRPYPAQRGGHGLARTRPPTPPQPRSISAAEPRRLELFRRLNLAPGGTAALVRMREQLIDAMDHRDDLAVVDNDFVHLFSSWFNRGFLVLRQDRLVDAGEPAGEDHPLRGGARDPRLERPARPHRFAATGAATPSSIRRWSTSP